MKETESNHCMAQLTKEIISAAILGFEEQKSRIDAQIAELRAMIAPSSNGSRASPRTSPVPAKHSRRRMSAAGRKAIAAGQRKRWAASKAKTLEAPPKPKRKLSAAGKAAIVMALRKRWAAKRAEAAGTKKTAAKK
uniref:Uncharacterized protein n=1 Tax=Solibacter usitatus (strain Ellin6076) TaxID=234267 RepID=Q01TI5_SOLUE